MIRRLVLFTASFALLSLAATGCGNDPKKAKIKSFTANPAILPTLGGETTLTWNVSGAESIEIQPEIGAVTGSSLTLTLTETTTFTLVAKKDGRSTRRKTTVTLAPPGAVAGIVRGNPNRTGLADVAVFCNGQATVTDQNGAFLFEDVPTPYDISLFDPANAFAMIFEGLTRLDPILEIPLSSGVGDFRQVFISGTSLPATADPDTTTFVFLKNEFSVYPPATSTDVAGNWASSTSWSAFSPEAARVAALGLRWVTNPMTSVTTFTHFGRTDLDADPLGPAMTGVSVPLSPVANTVATGQILLDPDEILGFNAPTMILGSATGATTDVGFVLPSEALVVTTAFAFTLATPDLAGSAVLWTAYGDLVSGSEGVRASRFAPGSTNVQIDLPELPRLLSPVDGGVVTRETVFQMSGLDESAKIWGFSTGGGPGSVQVVLITTRDRVTLPELPEAGIRFDDGVAITWNLVEISPLPRTDDLAGPDGLFGAAPELFAFTPPRVGTLDAP